MHLTKLYGQKSAQKVDFEKVFPPISHFSTKIVLA